MIQARYDLIGLHDEDKPLNQLDGTTYYEVDTTALYIYYKGTWYLQEKPEEDNSEEQNNEEE